MATEQTQHNDSGNPLRYLFQKTWHYSAGNRKAVVWYWVMFIVAETKSLGLYPLVMANIIDIIQKQGITATNIKHLLGLLILAPLIELVFWAMHGPARLIERRNAFKARLNYRKFLLKGALTMPLEWHVEHHSGDTIDKVNRGSTALFEFSQDSFEVIYAFVQLAISYGMLAYFSHSSAYIVAGMVLLTGWIIVRYDRILVPQYRELNHAENNVSESIFDVISNITTVIILRVERLVFEAIVKKMEKPYELFKRNNNLNELKWFFVNVCVNLMVVFVLGAYFVSHIGAVQGVLLGSVYILMKYLDKLSELFFKFAYMYGDIVQRKARVTNAEELTEDFKTENFTNHVLPPNWQQLEIEGLSFSYHNDAGADLHLDNVSLSFARGERIALVGETGSGKTTFLKLVRDLYHPRSLALSVDGKAVPHGFGGIARAIALVPQDPEIFATTIRENLTLGADYDPAFVQRFTDMACFTDVIGDLPHGLDSSVKEKGVNLSGGQQQRLALARGLLACNDKDIVLLDEPTSSLDVATDMRVHQNIFREFNGKTIISSSHRLHLLPMFHRICFFSGGQIVASGSLNELLSNCPEFQGIWQQYHESHQQAIA